MSSGPGSRDEDSPSGVSYRVGVWLRIESIGPVLCLQSRLLIDVPVLLLRGGSERAPEVHCLS